MAVMRIGHVKPIGRGNHVKRASGSVWGRAAAKGALLSLALFMNYNEVGDEAAAGLSGAARSLRMVYERIWGMVDSVSFQLTAAFAGFFLLFYLYEKSSFARKKIRFCLPVSLVLGFCLILARVYMEGVPFETSRFQMGKIFIAGLGYASLYDLLIHLLYGGLHALNVRGADPRPQGADPRPQGKLRGYLSRSPFLGSFFFLLLFHLPHLLVKYPAGLCNDVSWQIEQGLGLTRLTTHHPILHTMLMSWCTRLGMLFGSANAGIFLFALLQTILGAAVISYGIWMLTRIGAGTRAVSFARIFFALMPFVTGYVGQVLKDVLYTQFFLLFMIELIYWCAKGENFWTRGHAALLLTGVLLTCLLRNNGIYITAPVLALLTVRERKHLKRVLILLAGILLPVLAMKGLETGFHAGKGSIAEALSLPIQQTARYAALYDDAAPEEIEAISAVLPYDQIGALYHPYISDPVKDRFSKEADSAQLLAYFKAWLSQGLRHPRCYIEATLIQNISLFDPAYANYSYLIDVNPGYPWKKVLFTTPAFLLPLQAVYGDLMLMLHRIPVLCLMCGTVTYVLLTLILLLFMITDRIRGRWILYLPILLGILIIIAGPSIFYHMRYALPIACSFPFLLGYAGRPALHTDSR